MIYQLSNRLGAYAPGFDPEAKAIINAITTAGGTLTGAQKKAINTFVKTGDSEGWYSLLKRFYLPVWGAAGPNAVDWIERGSGTFVGTVTHGAGFVESDGTTSAFDSGATPSGCGMLQNSSTVGGIMIGDLGVIATMGGVQDSSNNTRISVGTFGTGQVGGRLNSSLSANAANTDNRGVNVYTRNNSTNVDYYIRTSGAFTHFLNNVALTSGGIASVQTMYFIAINSNGTIVSYAPNGRRFSMFFMALGMSTQQATDFSLAAKNLFEAASGLALP